MSFNLHTGAGFAEHEVRVHDGTGFVECDVYVHDGTGFVPVYYAVTFSPVAGNVSASSSPVASVTVTASRAVTWTYTKDAAVSCNRTSGSSATDITFTLSGAGQFAGATLNALGKTWAISLDTN